MSATYDLSDLDRYLSNLHPRVRCHAHRKNGEQCRQWAIRGGRVCRSHGGAAPQVRDAAIRRLADAGLTVWKAKILEKSAARVAAREARAARVLGWEPEEAGPMAVAAVEFLRMFREAQP